MMLQGSSKATAKSTTNDNNNTTTTTKTSEDYIVHGLDQIEPAFQYYDGIMYAGFIPTTPPSTTTTTTTTGTTSQPPNDTDNDTDNNNTSNNSNNDSGELMFWLYEPNHPIYIDTLVLWFNGGPGCSSFGGMLFENGPVTIPRYPAGYYGIAHHGPLRYNPYGWTNTTAIMYIEQPQGGTGFSQSGPVPDNETEIGRDVYQFVQNFYTIFDRKNSNDNGHETDKWRNKKLFLFGESYAGMFVPSIAHYMHKKNEALLFSGEQEQQQDLQKDSKTTTTHRDKVIHLAGIAVGNGWMDAQVQGPAVIDYAWWHGMIDSHTKHALHNEWLNCRPQQPQHHHHENKANSPFHKFTIPDECGIMSAVLQAAGMGVVDWGTPNAYDVTTWDPYLMLDLPTGSIHQFFNNPRVQEALHVVPPRQWVECMPGAGRRRKQRSRQLTKLRLPGELLLDNDQPASVVPYVADLLDQANIPVLIYNGDRDMTTNSQGSEMLLDTMVWDGAAGWANSSEYERGVWLPKVGKQLGGYIKQYQNLQFLVVYNSGHLVPFNQDEIALELVTRFLGNVSFLDKPLPKFHIHRTDISDSDAGREGVQTNSYYQSYHLLRGVVSATIFMVFGFFLGFVVSRRFQKRRGMYQAIPNN